MYTGEHSEPAGPLFERYPRPMRSRLSDPSTSHDAEAQLRKTGAMTESRRMTLETLRDYVRRHATLPTAGELAGRNEERFHEYSRRLPELRDIHHLVENGEKRLCTVRLKRMQTWEPVTP